MRLVPSAVVAAALLAATSASHAQSAYDYPWCLAYPWNVGGMSCYYTSYEQCMATQNGIGGSCVHSPYYRGQAQEPARRRKKHYLDKGPQ
jgi:hypothetical protein